MFSCSFSSDSFAGSVQETLGLQLKNSFGDIEAASKWFMQESGAELNVEGWDSVRQKVVINAMNHWKPDSFAEIVGRRSKRALNVINSFLHEHKDIICEESSSRQSVNHGSTVLVHMHCLLQRLRMYFAQ